jgi:excinuclease ABC subunit C
VKIVNTLLELIKELFPLRNCALDLKSEKINKNQFKVCLEYHIGNCKAPCVGKESVATYTSYIQQIELVLKGNLSTVVALLKQQMKDAAETLAFEEAEEFKSKIKLLENYKAKSTVVSPTIHQVDVATIEMTEKKAYVNYLVINNGAIIHGHTLQVTKKLDETEKDILSFVIPEMREQFNSQSKEVLIETPINNFELPDIFFSVPQRGDKKKLVELSRRNAKYVRIEKEKQAQLKSPEKQVERVLKQIQKDFRLQELPFHMECFDNSNFQGTNPVSACVVFKNAKPSKKDYRHFNIKTVEGPDDFASMTEAVYRRYKRLLDENLSLPQLVIVDGGKGQLSAGLKALEKLGLRGKLPIVGIAKRLEEIFFPGDNLPLYIDKKSESLKVVQYMRNEAHRFGIEHHRDKRSKSALVSELDTLEGIGPKTKEKLLLHFKTLSKIKSARHEEVIEIIGTSKAKIVRDYLQGLT